MIQKNWVSLMTSQIMPSIVCEEKKLLQVMVDEELGGISYSMLLGFSKNSSLENFKKTGVDLIYKTIDQSFAGQWVSFSTQLNLVTAK